MIDRMINIGQVHAHKFTTSMGRTNEQFIVERKTVVSCHSVATWQAKTSQNRDRPITLIAGRYILFLTCNYNTRAYTSCNEIYKLTALNF